MVRTDRKMTEVVRIDKKMAGFAREATSPMSLTRCRLTGMRLLPYPRRLQLQAREIAFAMTAA
jgi:hypothetical protein